MRMDVDASLYSMYYDRAKHLTEPHDRNPLLSHNNVWINKRTVNK